MEGDRGGVRGVCTMWDGGGAAATDSAVAECGSSGHIAALRFTAADERYAEDDAVTRSTTG